MLETLAVGAGAGVPPLWALLVDRRDATPLASLGAATTTLLFLSSCLAVAFGRSARLSNAALMVLQAHSLQLVAPLALALVAAAYHTVASVDEKVKRS